MKEKEVISVAESNNIGAVREQRKTISNTKTPKCYVEKKGDGYDYVDEAYMRDRLNYHILYGLGS